MKSRFETLISVVIPVYNLGERITVCLNSLKSQLNPSIELLIVNDGSTDNSLSIIQKFIKKNNIEDFCTLITTENQGVGQARNTGLFESKGNYVYFLDGDDYVSDKFVTTIISYINKYSDAQAFTFGYYRIDENNNMVSFFDKYSPLNEITSGREVLKQIALGNYWVWTASIVYKKSLLIKKSRTYNTYAQGQDIHFNFINLINTKKIIFINELLSFYYYRSNSITNIPKITKIDSFYMRLDLNEYIITNNTNHEFDFLLYFNQKSILDSFRQIYTFLYTNSNNKSSLKKDIQNQYPNILMDYKKVLKNYHGNNKLRFWFFYVSYKFNFSQFYMFIRSIKFLLFKPQY